MALIYIRNVIAIEFPVIVLLAYSCVMMLLADHDELMALAISFIPFSAAFQYKYAILALIVVYLIKYPKKVKYISAYIPMLLMLAWEMLHALTGAFSFTEMLRGFTELIFCSFIISLSNKKFDYALISRVYSLCVVFACSVVLLKLLSAVNYNFETIFLDGDYRFGVADKDADSYVMNYNANALGFMCNLSISGSILRVKEKGINIWDIALIIASSFFGFLTLSRSFILCLAILIVLFMFSGKKSISSILKNIIVFGTAVVVVLLVLNYAVPYIFENIIARFNEDDVTGNRAYLMEWYNNYIFSSPKRLMFGTGMQDIMEKANAESQIPVTFVPHNGTQEAVVVWGLPGLCLIVCFVLSIIAESRKRLKRQTLSNFVPLILLLIKVQSGQMITSGSTVLMFAFLYIILCTSFEKSKDSIRIEDEYN